MAQTPPDRDEILIFSFSGRLEKSDVEEAIRRFDAALERGGTVHAFVEITDFQGMSWDALRSDLGHALHYLLRLKQFGRFAIVSDQSWIRLASRLESALLPYIAYEVYTPDQRDHALAWVKGEIASPRPEPIRILAGEDPDIVAFEIDGRITQDAAKALRERVTEAVAQGGGHKVLAIVRQYDGFAPALLADRQFLEWKLSLLRQVTRYALVGGPSWMRHLIELSDPLLRMDIRAFAEGDEAAARAWLRGDASAPQP